MQCRNALSRWVAVLLMCGLPVMAQPRQEVRVDESLASSSAPVAEVVFSVPHGLYEQPFDVVLSTKTPDAQIWYTQDGTLPRRAQNGQFDALLYDRPIHVTGTTCLRAVAVGPDGQDSQVTSCTYIFPADIPKQFQAPPEPAPPNQSRFPKPPTSPTLPSLDPGVKTALQAIPSVCIVMEPNDFFDPVTGINANPNRRGIEWERPASMEWLDPTGRLSFQVNAGLRIHGGVSRGERTGKHSLRILFKSQYGPAWLEAPLFEDCNVTRFDSLVLRMTLHDSWMTGSMMGQPPQYLRDSFSRDTMRDMGRLTPYGRPVHVYINGFYWGLYVLTERPDDGFAAAHLGGSKDQYDALKAKSVSDPDPAVAEVVAGDLVAWDALFNLARGGLENPAAYEQAQQYLDMPSFIDYMLMIFYIGSTDGPAGIGGPPRNFWAVRPRQPGGGFVFLSWDLEFSLANLNENRVTVVGTEDPHYLFHQLAANAEFRMLLADQIHRDFFHDGALTPASATQRYLTRAAEVENALRAEAYRWGQDQKIATLNGLCASWRNERDRIVNSYFPLRTGIVVDQLKQAGLYPTVEPPALEIDGAEQNGGTTRSGARLSMINPNATGTIYYTADGSDPRLPCRPMDVNELVALVSGEAEKRVHIPESDIGDRWTGGSEPYDDAAWTDGTPVILDGGGAVGYTGSRLLDKRISYHVRSMMGRHTSCYIRIPFDAADLPRLSHLALRVQCDDGFVAYINGVEVASLNKPAPLAWNSPCADRPGSAASLWAYAPTDPSLLRPGRNILAVHALDNSSDTFFLFSIELFGSDHSITGGEVAGYAAAYTEPVALTQSTQIKARVWQNGTWSALTEAIFAVGPVKESLRITEIMYHPAPDDVEFVELANIGAEAINLNRVRFTEGIDFIFPDLVLTPGAATLVVQDREAFTIRYGPGRSVAGQYAGSLSNAGEHIQLQDAAGNRIQDFYYDDAWYDLTDGEGYSLERRDPLHQDPNDLSHSECWQPSPHAGGSPGTLE